MGTKIYSNMEIDAFLLSRKENLRILSSILKEYIKIYYELENLLQKKSNGLGKKITTTQDALQIIERIVPRIQCILSISINKEHLPIIKVKKQKKNLIQGEEYYSIKQIHSKDYKRTITLIYDSQLPFTTTLTHGIIHYLLDRNNIKVLKRKYSCFNEGFSRYTTILLAQDLADENSELYLYDVIEDALSDIWETICWLDRKFKRITVEEKIQFLYPFERTKAERMGKKPDEYARGFSYFLLRTKKLNKVERIEFLKKFL